MKILSWNIWFNSHFEEVKKFLQDCDADVFALQEVTPGDQSRDIISFLTGLGYQYMYATAFTTKSDGREVGNAIFTKHEIISSKIHDLPDTATRNVVQADIKIDGSVYHFFSTHLIHTHLEPSELQEAQADALIQIVPPERSIVCGDFNATPESAATKKINAAFINADPSFQPTWCLYEEGCHVCLHTELDICFDYIFTTPDVKLSEFKVEHSTGSDHLPISARIND
jgi:endonuclease/exonuclease/phosphatase family metal-dependent hydrolase